eukprot:SAG31_NODE_1602_length_7780_cov_8.304699_10_plen_94_part_00
MPVPSPSSLRRKAEPSICVGADGTAVPLLSGAPPADRQSFQLCRSRLPMLLVAMPLTIITARALTAATNPVFFMRSPRPNRKRMHGASGSASR